MTACARALLAAVALACAAALVLPCACAPLDRGGSSPAVSPVVRVEPVPAPVSRPLPSTGADREPPSPADADDSKMKHVWSSHDDPAATSAPADGSIARWNGDDWYIVHDYSRFGAEFLGLEEGDLVRIDGRTIRIKGAVDEPRDSYSNEIRAQVGDDVTIFQTCFGQSALRVAYGDEVAASGAVAGWRWEPDAGARALFDEIHGR